MAGDYIYTKLGNFRDRLAKHGFLSNIDIEDVVLVSDDIVVLKSGLTIHIKKDIVLNTEYVDWYVPTE